MIVDAHAHLGECRVFDLNISDSELLSAMDANGVSAAIVRPFPGAPNPAEVHDRISSLASNHDGRFFGVASVNPHINYDVYRREIERCVHQLGFVGVELHTAGHAINPLGQDARRVFDIARELGIAVVINTGFGLPFALPALCLPRAQEYPDVRIVLQHAGYGVFASDAYVAARQASNIYLETSGSSGHDLKWLIDELGPDRVMLGSDLPSNVTVELAKYRSVELHDYQLNQSLARTAVDVFNLRGVQE